MKYISFGLLTHFRKEQLVSSDNRVGSFSIQIKFCCFKLKFEINVFFFQGKTETCNVTQSFSIFQLYKNVSKMCEEKKTFDVVHGQIPHLLTSISLVVFLTPCDISWLKPFRDESRKDVSSIHCNMVVEQPLR